MKSWLRWAVASLTVLLFAAVGSAAPQNNSDQNMPTGKDFITHAAQINLAEIELGNLAQQKGNNDAVRQFGKLMVTDHTNAQNELKQLAAERNFTLPAQPEKAASNLDTRLSHMSGAQFDQDYVRHMLQGHDKAVAEFENEIEHGRDPAIKAYAEKILPTIQDHIRIAEDLAGKMGMSGNAGLSQPDKAIAASAQPR